ncbi:hypothetical protein BH23ACT9_BH23ACT9_14700 [soil metagenome]
MESTREAVAAAVKDRRTRKGWTLERLSAALDNLGHHMSVATLSKTEKGQRTISADDVVAIATALGLPPAVLLPAPAGEPDTSHLDEARRRLRVAEELVDMRRQALEDIASRGGHMSTRLGGFASHEYERADRKLDEAEEALAEARIAFREAKAGDP